MDRSSSGGLKLYYRLVQMLAIRCKSRGESEPQAVSPACACFSWPALFNEKRTDVGWGTLT